MTQLDRIEQKLDKLLAIVGATVKPPEDEFMLVLTTQGLEAAHKWQKDKNKRERVSKGRGIIKPEH